MYEDGWARIGAIAIDAVVREVHKFAGEVTEHPVEEGADISDHYRPAPRGVQLEGVISDTPLRVPGSHSNDAQQIQRTFDIPTELFALQLGPIPIRIAGPTHQGSVTTFSKPMERVKSTWEEFEAIFAQQKIITIVTTLRVYPDMALRELDVERRANSYHFTCFALQIRTVVSGRSAAAIPIPKVKRAVPTVEKGKQDTAPVEPAKRSLAVQAGLAKLIGLGT
jgi:hypothetical protein